MNSAHFSAREDVDKTILAGGTTLLTQVVPDALSVAVGVWIKRGSRDENGHKQGITHFLEHMVFKGTERRDTLEIALAMDRIGGQIDAFTTKELTCFNARVLAEHFDTALDLLADLLSSPRFDDDMIELEKRVVVEEIHNVLDDPDDWIHDLASQEVFGAHPLGRPILGSEESVAAIDRSDLRQHQGELLRGGNVVLAVAGPLEHERLREHVAAAFAMPEGGGPSRAPECLATPAKRVRVVGKDLNQQHLWIGRRSLGIGDPDRYGLQLLTILLGGGMSSRLFQAIREQAGLSYNVFSFSDFVSDSGLTATYMAVAPHKTDEALRRTLDEYVRLIAGGCGEEELEDTKMQLKGNLLLAMESVGARMSRLARTEINEGRFVGIKELVERIDAVSPADIQRLAAEHLDPEALTLVSIGPNPSVGPF